MKQAISNIQRMAGIMSADDPDGMLDMGPRGGASDDDDNVEPEPDDDDTNSEINAAADHINASHESSGADRVAHLTAARDALTRHLQKIGAEDEPPVRTQFAAGLHTVIFPGAVR